MCTTPSQNDGPPISALCCCAVFCHPYRRIALFAFSNFVFIPSRGSNERPLSRIRLSRPNPASLLLSSRAPNCDPCRGFRSSDPPPRCFHSSEGLKRATPVEDSALPARLSLPLSSLPRRLHSVTPVLTRGETVLFPALWTSPPLGAAWHSVGIAAVVRAPRMCGLLAPLGGRAGYGKNRSFLDGKK